MNGASDLMVSGLALAGGGALGAVFGVVLGLGLKWTAGWLAAIAVSLGAAGAVIGLMFVGDAAMPKLPSLSDLLPKFGQAAYAADAERVLKTYYPDDYAAGEQTASAMRASGATNAQIEQAMIGVALPLMQRQLPLASTDNTLAMLQLTRDEQEILAKDPQLCLRVMMQPGADTAQQMQDALPDDLKTRQEALAIKILEQTATKPQPPNPTADTDQKLKLWMWEAGSSLTFEERDALKAATEGGASDAAGAAACKVMGSLLMTMAYAPPGDATEIYKALEAKGVERMGG